MRYKLLILHAEETLLQADGSIAQADVDALLDLQERGTRLAIITDHSIETSEATLAPLQLIKHEGFVLRRNPEVMAIQKSRTPAEILIYDISTLLQQLMIKRSEAVAIGASRDSVPMMEFVGLGVAMADSEEAVKACADYVTTSLASSGVAHLIKKHMTEDLFNAQSLQEIDEECRHSLIGNLGIKMTYIDEKQVEATMPIDERTCQPWGVLHGGASLAFAETIAGIGSRLHCKGGEIAVGMQVSGNHVSSALLGDTVTGRATIIHQGRSSHVWNVDIITQAGKLVSSVRVINSILKKR